MRRSTSPSPEPSDTFRRELHSRLANLVCDPEIFTQTRRLDELSGSSDEEDDKQKFEEDEENLKFDINGQAGRMMVTQTESSYMKPAMNKPNPNKEIIRYVIERVPEKYQSKEGVSVLGLACTVSKDYSLTDEEEEGFARILMKFSKGQEFISLHELATCIKYDVGIFAVRESTRALYEKKIAEALDKVRISNKIVDEAESFYMSVKNAESSLSKKSGAIKGQVSQLRSKLSNYATSLLSGPMSEMQARATQLENKLQTIVTACKNLVPRERLTQSRQAIKLLKARLAETEEALDECNKLREKEKKLRERLEKEFKGLKEKSNLVSTTRGSQDQGENAISETTPKKATMNSISIVKSTKENFFKGKKEYSEKSTQTSKKEFEKQCIQLLQGLSTGGIESRAYLFMYQLSEENFECPESLFSKVSKSNELGSYLIDSGLVESVIKRKPKLTTTMKFLLKIMLDKAVKANSPLFLENPAYSEGVINLTQQSLEMKDEGMAEQAVILLEKVSALPQVNHQRVSAVAKELATMLDAKQGIWKNNSFLASNLKVININLSANR